MGQRRQIRKLLWDDGTHMADIIMYLTSGMLTIDHISGNIKEKAGTVFLLGKSGEIPVCIEAGVERDHIVFQLELSFEVGMIRIGNGVYEEFESGESPYYTRMRSLIPKNIHSPEKTDYFRNMVKDAVRCARGKNYYPVSSAVNGLNAVKFLASLDEFCHTKSLKL